MTEQEHPVERMNLSRNRWAFGSRNCVLKENGQDPYKYDGAQTHHATDIVADFERLENETVSVAGRLRPTRHGKSLFLPICSTDRARSRFSAAEQSRR